MEMPPAWASGVPQGASEGIVEKRFQPKIYTNFPFLTTFVIKKMTFFLEKYIFTFKLGQADRGLSQRLRMMGRRATS
jgi:hypothetical protein